MVWRRGWDSNPTGSFRFCKLQILKCQHCRECQHAVGPCPLLPARSRHGRLSASPQDCRVDLDNGLSSSWARSFTRGRGLNGERGRRGLDDECGVQGLVTIRRRTQARSNVVRSLAKNYVNCSAFCVIGSGAANAAAAAPCSADRRSTRQPPLTLQNDEQDDVHADAIRRGRGNELRLAAVGGLPCRQMFTHGARGGSPNLRRLDDAGRLEAVAES